MQLHDDADRALGALLRNLDEAGYDFVTVTPATHARVVGRPGKRLARDLRDAFGWNLPFAAGLLPAGMFEGLRSASLIEPAGANWKSRVRVSRIDGHLFLHSAFPTEDKDAVFLGPDSFRFARFIRAELEGGAPVRRLVDLGAGAGVGALCAASLIPNARLTLVDLNPAALRLAAANARHAGVEVETVEGGDLDAARGPVDLVIANPPYIMDEGDRTYRDGGDLHGAGVSRDWTIAAARRLEPGGRMLLYTGVAIVEGRDQLREELERRVPTLGCTLRYREIDPDVFGEELEEPRYADVERIAVVAAVVEKR